MTGSPPDPMLRLRRYVVSGAPHSEQALANLKIIRNEHLDTCKLEVIDVFDAPERALEDGVIVTPTLLRISPGPVRRIIGDLNEIDTVVSTLLTGSENH